MKRSVTVVLLSLAVLAGLLVARAGAAGAAPPAIPAGAGWPVTAALALGGDDVATSCPTATVCTAAGGGELLTTADGGTTWNRATEALPADVAAVVDLDCPTAAVCVLVTRLRDGSTAVLTGPGGGPFTRVVAPDAGTATAVACPTANHCLVTDGETSWTTRDRGATWRSTSLPRIAYSDQQITCVAGTNACVVFGNNGFDQVVLTTRDDGRSWTVRDAGAFDGLYALDCPTVDVCVAGGRVAQAATIRRTVDGGATWTAVGVPFQPYGVESLSCAGVDACVATGLTPGDTPFVWATTTGTSFAPQPVTAVTVRPAPEVDCPAAGVCRAVGAGVAYVTDDGSTWTDRSLPAALDSSRALDCPRANACVVLGTDARDRPVGFVSTDSGATWNRTTLPDSLGEPAAVDCVAGTSTCVVVGSAAPPGNGREQLRSAWTTDLGATWSAGRPTTTVGHVYELACASTTACLATGYDRRGRALLWRTTDGGARWAPVGVPTGAGELDDVACTGPTSCVVLADGYTAPELFRTDDLGTTWTSVALPDAGADHVSYVAVDCSGGTCLAVGDESSTGLVARSTDGGATWTRTPLPGNTPRFSTVSCGSATTCATTAFVYDGQGGGSPVAYGTADAGVSLRSHRLATGRVLGSDIACAGARCYVPQENRTGVPVVLAGRA